MLELSHAVWVRPDGSGRPVRLKGGPLYETFFDTARQDERGLSAAPGDLARAYSSVVWAYRCIKLRADAVAGVPLALFERDGTPIADHPLLTLLRDVNPHTMNLSELLRATEAAYNIWGCAYWLLARGSRRDRRPQAIQWLNPQTVEAITDPQRGVLGYRQQAGGRVREIAAEDVIAFRNFDPLDDLGGLSPLGVALCEVNAELNVARFAASFFANDARPAGLLVAEQPMQQSEIDRTQAWWERLFRGAQNKWRTGIIGSGLKWQPITQAPGDLALSELRAEDRRAICAAFGVPPGLAGAWESTTYATAREQKASFYEDTILPQLEYLAETLNWSLLPCYPDLAARGARLGWDVDSIAALRESAGARAARLVQLYEAGVITRSEVRTRLGMAARPGEEDGMAGEMKVYRYRPRGAGRLPGGSASPAAGPVRALAIPERLAQDDLKRWERFAMQRVRRGRPLRPFASEAIPASLRARIEDGLARVESVEDVFVLFGEVWEELYSRENRAVG